MKAIKFDFASKSYNDDSKGIRMKGTCYFLLNNDGVIIAQIPQIIYSEYRKTDLNMVNTLVYWQKNNEGLYYVQEFRKKFLPEKNIEDIKKDLSRGVLNKEQLVRINVEFLKNKYSILTCLSFLIGSNISGCQTYKLNQPFFYISNKKDDNYNFFNPFNPFKSLRSIDKSVTLKSLEDIKSTLTIEEYFKEFPEVKIRNKYLNTKKTFEDFNSLISKTNKDIKPKLLK